MWVIFDLCGTLANISHRLPEIKEGKYFASMEKIPYDILKTDIYLLHQMALKWGCKIAIVTGRDAQFEPQTRAWLKEHDIHYDEMYMRPEGSNDSDSEIKQKIYSGFFQKRNVLFVVDDRQQVVDMWRRNGLTCLQCQKGDY